MDNRSINITSEGEKHFALAIELAWLNAAGGKATHYRVCRVERHVTYSATVNEKLATNCEIPGTKFTAGHYSRDRIVDGKPNTLILLWHEESGATPLPFPMNLQRAIEFASGWLSEADYGREPDHDGSNDKGWRVFMDGWGHVADHRYAIVGVQPAWAMYGK